MLRFLRFSYALALFCLGIGAARAQVYEPGLLVRANGDTLRGELENDFWRELPTFIRYRRTPDSPSELLVPRQLRAVRFAQGRYFRYEVLPIDHAAETRTQDLPQGNVPYIYADSVLAEVLVEGPVMLWRVPRPGAMHYLLRRPGQPVLDLSERRYLTQLASGQWVAQDGNNFRNQLELYFGDCPAVLEALPKARFTAPGLVAIVQAYYQGCTPARQPAPSWLAYTTVKHRTAFQAGLLAGVRYNNIASPVAGLGDDCQDCLPHPFGGLYAEVMQPSRTAAIYGELSLSQFQNKTLMETYYSGDRVYSYKALLGTARLGVRCFLPRPHEQYWLLTIGLELNAVLNPQVTQLSGTPATLARADIRYAPTALLPNLGIGWRRQRISVTLDGQFYALDRSNEDFLQQLVGSNIAARLGVGYRLGHAADAHHKGNN